MAKRTVRPRHDSHKAPRVLAMVIGIVLVFGFVKAGFLPAVPAGEGEWLRWGLYGLGGAVVGTLGYEGWRFALK